LSGGGRGDILWIYIYIYIERTRANFFHSKNRKRRDKKITTTRIRPEGSK
jgi:hypothetical protein